MHHFFVPPEWIRGPTVAISGPVAHQIANVLRLRSGSYVVLLDNSGWQYEVELTAVAARQVEGKVLRKRLVRTEPHTKVTLYQTLLRATRFELVLQKGTELGVSAFVPVIGERTLMREVRDAASAKWERWERIVREAAEQSERGKLPTLRPVVTFPQACEDARGLSVVAWERGRAPSLPSVLAEWTASQETVTRRPRPFAVNVFIGPEGGFTDSEIRAARSYGITPVGLGPRILRAETAALVATLLVLSAFGDLGG